MNRKGAPDPTVIDTLTKFNDFLENISVSKLVVVDLHREWCGPATAITPFWNKCWTDLSDVETRLEVCTMCLETINDKELSDLVAKGCEVKLDKQGCKPTFILLRSGQIVATVDGLNTAVLGMMMDIHLPKIKKKDEE
jgi:hypothetical protein